jgi:multiple antibiotic resistance protein
MEEFFKDIIPFSTLFMSALGLFAASFSSLFSVVNPFAAMPIYISLMEGHTDSEKIRTARKASTYMFFVLIIFLLIGTFILSFFGISLPGIQIAGGLVIVRSGFSMLSPQNGGKKLTKKDQEAAMEKEDVSFSPLAMPLLSGPGSIAVVIGFGSEAQGITDYIVNGVAVFATAFLAYLILRISPKLVKYIGSSGMSVITRMMGFIVLAIGVQFVINGISKFYGIG